MPVGNDIFRKIVVRGSRVPQVETRNLSLQHWTDQWYYEVCTNPAIYAKLKGKPQPQSRLDASFAHILCTHSGAEFRCKKTLLSCLKSRKQRGWKFSCLLDLWFLR